MKTISKEAIYSSEEAVAAGVKVYYNYMACSTNLIDLTVVDDEKQIVEHFGITSDKLSANGFQLENMTLVQNPYKNYAECKDAGYDDAHIVAMGQLLA